MLIGPQIARLRIDTLLMERQVGIGERLAAEHREVDREEGVGLGWLRDQHVDGSAFTFRRLDVKVQTRRHPGREPRSIRIPISIGLFGSRLQRRIKPFRIS